MKNNISKITLTSTLLLSTMATAKNFYTCVPKESYIRNLATQEINKDNDFKCLKNKIKCEENNKKINICINDCLCDGKNKCNLESIPFKKKLQCSKSCNGDKKQDCQYCF